MSGGLPPGYWKDNPYINAATTIVDQVGGWLPTFGIRVATWVVTFDTSSTNVAGSLILEGTAVDTAPAAGDIYRILLPAGSFHTNLSGWAFDTGNVGLKLTAAAAQQGSVCLSITNPPVGRIRLTWDATAGGGAGNNTLVVRALSWGP